jgi:hypothetical protein
MEKNSEPYSTIYKKLLKIIPDLPKHIREGKHSGKSQLRSPEMMDLHFEYASDDENGNPIISLAHYSKMNGDSVPDPSMEIRIMCKSEIAEALSFQNHLVYRRIYEYEDGKEYVSLKLKNSMNNFLSMWLTGMIEHGHRIDLSKENERTNEMKQVRGEKSDAEREQDRGR